MTASSAGDSTYRYNAAVVYSATQFTSNTSSGIVALSQLYPDSSYNVYAQAQNNSSFTGYGPTGPAGILSATSLSAPAASAGTFSYTSPANTFTAKLVASNSSGNTTNQSVSPVIIGTSPAPLTNSSSVTNAIQTLANRGKGLNGGTTSILDVSASVVRPAGLVAGVTQSAALAYNGFLIATPSTVTVAGFITLTPSTPLDAYVAQTSALQGYYLTASNTVTISSSVFISSNDKNTVSLTARQNTAGGATSTATPYLFYYDASGNAVPTFTSTPSIKMMNTSSAYQVSGIYILEGTIDLSCNTSIATNIGQYFYNNSQILAYGSSGTSETTTTNVTSSLTGGKFNYPVTFRNSTITNPQTNTFATAVSLTVTAYSPTNLSTAGTAATITAILDQPSYNLITDTTLYPTTPNTTPISLAVESYGCRIDSSFSYVGGSYNDNIPIVNPNPLLATTQYVQSKSLIQSQDLQLTNGTYQTNTSSNGYLNYSSYFYGPTQQNSLDYSTTTIANSGYRYATFTFKASNGGSSATYNTIRFKVNGITSLQTLALTGTQPTVNSVPIYFAFRLTDDANPNTFNGSTNNTSWLDATNNAYTAVGAGNFNTSTAGSIFSANAITANTFSSGTLTINSVLYPVTFTSSQVYVYFRICAPMNADFKFESVQAKFMT
jgi:hypothetical protein